MEEEIERYLELVREDPLELREIPYEIRKNYPEICMEVLNNLLAMEEVEGFGRVLEYIPTEVQLQCSDSCIEFLKKQHHLGIMNEIIFMHLKI